MSSLNSQDIELICQVLCDEITGSKITAMLTTLGLPVGDEGYTKWRRLSAILINACTNQGLKHLLLSIAQLYRNTNAHSLKLYNPNNLNDAITALTLMSLAHNLLDNCSNARRLD